jgi:S-phase kinase-associated protein 1
LEPLKNINDDPRIRLLNRLYAKKRKELQERHQRQKLKVTMTDCTCLCSAAFSDFTQWCSWFLLNLKFTVFQGVQVQKEQKDERSLDELLCFINGDGGITTVSYIDYMTCVILFTACS